MKPFAHAAAALLAALACLPLAASAQDWPNRQLRLVVPFPPGGTSDIVARLVAQPLAERLKQTVIVDNRPGGGTTIGAKAVISANDAAHTLFVSNSAPISIAPFLFDALPYDPIKDFTHVAMIGTTPNAFFVSSTIPVENLAQYIEWVKAQGKPVPFGSGGGGSIGHIVGEMFKNELKLQMEHVAYKGSSPMFQDMLGGHLKVGVNTLPEVWEFAKQGRLRVVALTAPARARIAPNVPTVVELGYPKLVAENFVGISGPAGMPAAAVARLNAAVNDALGDPKLAGRLEELGMTVQKLSAPAFAGFVQKQVTEFQPGVKASGAKLN
ncbi:MAG: tripartite tricarboxylate transporter substrate binding protein [Burkholderiales bacterium]|nr:tripartite tricarboxylate transporter substrate binding protein [Burkholderiales bacterium]